MTPGEAGTSDETGPPDEADIPGKATTADGVRALDEADDLSALRARYNFTPGVLRLDGNSGGALPSTTPARLRRFVEHRWDTRCAQPVAPGGSTLNDDAQSEARLAAAELAAVIGAEPDEIAIAESISMNLFTCLLGAARLRPDHPLLAVGHDSFANDQYLARSAAEFAGRELRLLRDTDDLKEALRGGVAAVALSHVDVLSGEIRDPVAFTRLIHEHGGLVLWDLSHSAGALRIALDEWGADFAIGCGYRFLGGGAGAPAYSYVAHRHHAALAALGEAAADPLNNGFGGPSGLSMAELRAGLSILSGIRPEALETKSTRLIEIFRARLLDEGIPTGMEIVEPVDGARRGGHLCVRHRHAQYLAHGLLARGVVVDFLEPDMLRFSFAPSWLRYVDAWKAAGALREVTDEFTC